MLSARIIVSGVNQDREANHLLQMFEYAYQRESKKALGDDRYWKVAKGYEVGTHLDRKQKGYYDTRPQIRPR